MANKAMEPAYLEQLHRLYYNLQHRILPDIILSENSDKLLLPNLSGEGLLGEAGTSEADFLISKAVAEQELEKHIAEQEEKRIELEAFDFDEEAPEFLFEEEEEDDCFTDEDFTDKDDYNFADDDYSEEEDYAADDEGFLDDLPEEDEEETDPDVTKFMAELEKLLELGNLKGNSDNPDENFLNETWRDAWFDTTLEVLPDNKGYTLQRFNRQDYEIVLFTFPDPLQIPDAYLAAAIRKSGEPYRYYTLEATVSKDEDTAILAEWKANGVHRNSGSQTTDVKNTEAFLEMIFEDLTYSY